MTLRNPITVGGKTEPKSVDGQVIQILSLPSFILLCEYPLPDRACMEWT
jgi:hypothetical protein